jgi:hypothetical protein
VLELLAKEKAVVLCAHLHRYSVLKYQAASGPVVQITLNSVVRDRSRTEPYWKETEYGPGLVDLEPEYAPNDAARRRHILSNKAKNMKEFRVADLPGYGILKIKGGQITIDIYANATKTLHETVNISQMLEN